MLGQRQHATKIEEPEAEVTLSMNQLHQNDDMADDVADDDIRMSQLHRVVRDDAPFSEYLQDWMRGIWEVPALILTACQRRFNGSLTAV